MADPTEVNDQITDLVKPEEEEHAEGQSTQASGEDSHAEGEE
jgi:hypothetical protein